MSESQPKKDNALPDWLDKWIDAHKGLTVLIAAGLVLSVIAIATPFIKSEMESIDKTQDDYAAAKAEKDKREAAEEAAEKKRREAAEAAKVQVPDTFKDDPGLVTRDDMGDEWPLTVDFGALDCHKSTVNGIELLSVTFRVPHMQYAVNGTAKANTPFTDIDEIWADVPGEKGMKIDIGPFLDRGLTRC